MTTAHSPKKDQSSTSGCINLILLIAVSTWISAVLFGSSIAELVVTSIAYLKPNYYWAIFPVIKGILLIPLLLPLALFLPHRRLRAVFHSWLWMSMLIVLYIPVRFTSATASLAQSILHFSLGVIFISLILIGRRWTKNKHIYPEQDTRTRDSPVMINKGPTQYLPIFIALITATLFSYPWLAWGAFGSLVETFLQLLVALILGIIAALILELYLIHPLQETSADFTPNYLLGGFAFGVLLLIMGSATGFSFGGMQLLLMICLPPLGWIGAGLRQINLSSDPLPTARSKLRIIILPVVLLVGLACASPLTLIDPDELLLLISASPGEILLWGLYAAFVSAGIALFSGILFFIIYQIPVMRNNSLSIRPALAGFLLMFVIIGAFGIYTIIGQPGFYGEGLFVILKDQADLQSITLPKDPIERRRIVYHSLVSHAEMSQANICLTLEQLGFDYTPFYLLNGLHVQGGPLIRYWLATRPEVERVLDNPWLRPLPR